MDVLAIIWPPVVLLVVALIAVAIIRRRSGIPAGSRSTVAVLIGIAVAVLLLILGTALLFRR